MAQPLFPKQQIAKLIGEISSSLKRGYINELTAQALFTLLQNTNAVSRGSPSFSDAYRDAQTVYNIVRKLPGEQMRDIPPEAEAQIRQALRRLIRTVYSIELPDRAKAAAVIAAAKAVGVKASPDTRHRIAYIATRIRSDIQNGYINIDLASILRALTAENAKGQPPTSNAALARDLAGDLYKLAMGQTGNQMRDLPGKTAEYARGYLVRIIRAVQKDGIPA